MAGAGKGGAPSGNTNAIIHGLRASKLPPGCSWIQSGLKHLRRTAREQVIAKHGESGLWSEALLQSMWRHEARAQLALKWLREQAAELDMNDRLRLLDTISKATDSRDKCLERLGIERRQNSDPWASIDCEVQSPRLTHSADPPTSESPTAPAGPQAAAEKPERNDTPLFDKETNE